MQHRTKTLLGLALIGLGSIQGAQAVTFYACNGCSEAQRASKALAMGVGYHYIDDITHNVAEKFHVTSEPAAGHNQYFVDLADIEPAAASAFTNYRQFLLSNGSSSLIYQNVNSSNPSYGFPSANGNATGLDFVTTPAYQNSTQLWLNNVQASATTTTWLSSAASLALVILNSPYAFDGQAVTVEFNIRLNDGSVVIFDVDSKGSRMVKALDNNGNEVPLDKTKVHGTYAFGDANGHNSDVDIAKWVRYMQGLGVPVSNPTSGGKSIVCTPEGCTIEVW